MQRQLFKFILTSNFDVLDKFAIRFLSQALRQSYNSSIFQILTYHKNISIVIVRVLNVLFQQLDPR